MFLLIHPITASSEMYLDALKGILGLQEGISEEDFERPEIQGYLGKFTGFLDNTIPKASEVVLNTSNILCVTREEKYNKVYVSDKLSYIISDEEYNMLVDNLT